jgi:hypothetical protein
MAKLTKNIKRIPSDLSENSQLTANIISTVENMKKEMNGT